MNEADLELCVTLGVLSELGEYDRVQVKQVAQPQVEQTGLYGYRQSTLRALRGETRGDMLRRLRSIVDEAEASNAPMVKERCGPAAEGLERMQNSTYQDDARTRTELGLLGQRLKDTAAIFQQGPILEREDQNTQNTQNTVATD